MPRKGDKRKGRRTRASTTPVPQPAAGGSSNGPSSSSNSKPSPPTKKGRKTINSLKGRQPPAKPTTSTGVKRTSNGGRGIKRKHPQDQSTYISDDQIVYKPNGKGILFSVC